MGVARQHSVTCRSCKKTYAAELVQSANVTRFPAQREQILAGTFHRFACPHCGAQATVERSFSYVDVHRNTLILVRPRGDRHQWQEVSEELDTDLAKIPDEVMPNGERTARVVFGIAELREKLVAQDAGLDDRDVEMLKALVVYDHPFLLQRPRLRLLFTEATPTELVFVATYDHDQRTFRAAIPRAVAEPLTGDGGALRAWAKDAHGARSMYAGGTGHWVNMWGWSARTWSLAMLGRYAATIRANGTINLRAAGFKKMLANLPRGSQLPTWAKQALKALYDYGRAHGGGGALEDQLFEIRFGKELEDDWSTNNAPNDIATLWDLMKDLPDTNVEGNVDLNEIFLDAGSGGGFYEPWSGDIHIGAAELNDTERFQDVMRHEIGHAVHENQDVVVDSWLGQRFGWRSYEPNQAGIDAWVAEMGGWGALSSTQRTQVRQFVAQALGPGSTFMSGPAPNPPANHVWRAAGFGPRLAYERSGTNWWTNHPNWFRVGGRAFFMNFWYRSLMSVDTATLALVGNMPSSYAAMSPFEFFAETYALFYDLDDPQRSNVPADVQTWLTTNIGPALSGQPSPSGRPAAPTVTETHDQYSPPDVPRPAPAEPTPKAKRRTPAKRAAKAPAKGAAAPSARSTRSRT